MRRINRRITLNYADLFNICGALSHKKRASPLLADELLAVTYVDRPRLNALNAPSHQVVDDTGLRGGSRSVGDVVNPNRRRGINDFPLSVIYAAEKGAVIRQIGLVLKHGCQQMRAKTGGDIRSHQLLFPQSSGKRYSHPIDSIQG